MGGGGAEFGKGVHMERRRAQNSSLIAGLVLIVLGLFFFAGTQALIPWNWLNLD